jgi:glycine/D-amino acid oxidase-like deaminating enzyme
MGRRYNAVVIGGGFFGCEVALALRRGRARRVVVVERESGLLRRASLVNQARVHNGYHNPRSLPTALRSHRNFARFCHDYRFAIHSTMTKLYAIARDSRVGLDQFERFCRSIGAPFRPLGLRRSRLFDDTLIEEAYEVEEFAFDPSALARHFARKLTDARVEVLTDTTAHIAPGGQSHVTVELNGEPVEAGYVFNCTYAALQNVGVPISTRIKRELCEVALIEPPRDLAGIGVTVMDGPFFSTMPFPAAHCHSLTHVRYTPHEAWNEPERQAIEPRKSNFQSMLRDGARYMPCLTQARYIRSLFETKAVLLAAEDDDGRPVLFERSKSTPRVVSILGAKLDNIYDIMALLEDHAGACNG